MTTATISNCNESNALRVIFQIKAKVNLKEIVFFKPINLFILLRSQSNITDHVSWSSHDQWLVLKTFIKPYCDFHDN